MMGDAAKSILDVVPGDGEGSRLPAGIVVNVL